MSVMSDMHSLRFLEREGHLWVSAVAVEERQPLDVGVLRALLGEAGFGDWYLSEPALEKFLQLYALSKGELELEIGEKRDGSFSLEVSPDALHVWVNVVPAQGGAPVSTQQIYGALSEAGCCHGIQHAAVEAISAMTEPGRVEVAAGTPPENGRDTDFEMLVADTVDRVPKVNEHGLVDFRELGAIPLVVANQPLMRRIPATAGKPGKNVHGEVLEPLPGNQLSFEAKLLGAYPDKDDPNLLLAVFNGQPVRHGNGVSVEQVLHLKDVDIACGNVSFDGAVDVQGDVLPGMKVHATGDIVVSGVVDGAELEAGGDIRIGGGVIAHANVHAGGSVSARFVENARIRAGVAIQVDDMVLESDVQAQNQVIVGNKSRERGRLVGGSTRAMMLVRVPLLGGSAGGLTLVEIGVDPALEAKLKEVRHKLHLQEQEEANLDKLVRHLISHGTHGELLERAEKSHQHAVEVWGALLAERDALEKEHALIAGARLEIGVGVEGATDLTFGKKILHVRQNYGPGAFLLDEEHIVFVTPAARTR